MSSPVSVRVDTSQLDRAMALYLRETSKSIVDAVNVKLYDAARAALKANKAASKSDIRSKLNEVSSQYPGASVAEVIILKRKQASGEEVFDLEKEVNKLISGRNRTIGFLKSGWLPALKILLSKVKGIFGSATIYGVRRPSHGGAEAAKQIGSNVFGSVFNDVAGTGNGNKSQVEHFKQEAAQAGIDKITRDMATYLEKKLGIPADKFNRS